MKTSILARATGVALGAQQRLTRNRIEKLFFGSHYATSMSTRHDFVFAAPRPNYEGFTQQYFRLSC
jgi:hypothetical protein